MKICKKCKELKPPSEYKTRFHKGNNRHVTNGKCNNCIKIENRERGLKFYHANKERINSEVRIRSKSPESMKARARRVSNYKNDSNYLDRVHEYNLIYRQAKKEELKVKRKVKSDLLTDGYILSSIKLTKELVKNRPEIIEAVRLNRKIFRKIKNIKNGKK